MSLSKPLLVALRLFCIACLSFSSSTFALRVGVIDEMSFVTVQGVSKVTKSASDKLEKLTRELRKLYEELEERTLAFGKNVKLMDEKTLKQIQGELIKLDKRVKSHEEAIKEQRSIIQNQIEQRLLDAAVKLAKQKQLNLVLGKMKGVLYADATLDMTQEMINIFPQSETASRKKVEEIAHDDQTISP